MKNAHLKKWHTSWGSGLMEGNVKYVCNHNSNVYTAFRARPLPRKSITHTLSLAETLTQGLSPQEKRDKRRDGE